MTELTATDTAARAADIRTTTYKLGDGTRLTADRTAMRSDLDWACDQVAALVARVETLEAALRSLKHQYLPNMPACDCPTCRAIDRALSAGGTTPPPLPSTSGGDTPEAARSAGMASGAGGVSTAAESLGGAVAPQVEDTPCP